MIGGTADLHAPHLVDVEVTHALRRLVATGQLGDDRASDARVDAADLLITRYPHLALLERAWEFAHLTVYDGVYVALPNFSRRRSSPATPRSSSSRRARDRLE